ncbi:MAG TPA: sn-glycerol-3-phosphate transporter [Casimicrobiaceae bacterium]
MNRRLVTCAAVGSIACHGMALAQTPAPASDAAAVSAPQDKESSLPSKWDAPEPWRTDRFYLETSVFTTHFHSDPNHDNHQDLLLGEWNITEEWLVGASAFANSFGQSSQYVYGGYRFRPFESAQQLYFKVSAGIVHGYSGQYQNKIPLNSSGFAPVIVPSVGYCIVRYCSELVIFGTAGALLTVGVTIP